MPSKKRPPRPAPRPTHPVAKRLEDVRRLKGIPSLKDFWKALGGLKGAGCGYEAVRNYHYNREAPVNYLSRVVEVFPEVRLDYLARGVGKITHAEQSALEKEHQRNPYPLHEVIRETFYAQFPETKGRPSIASAEIDQALFSAYWAILVFAIEPREFDESKQRYGRRWNIDDEIEINRAIGTRLGRAVRAPLQILGYGTGRPARAIEMDSRRLNAYVVGILRGIQLVFGSEIEQARFHPIPWNHFIRETAATGEMF